MKKVLRVALLAALALMLSTATAFATPLLQLDISNGIYNGTTETIQATSSTFTLYTLLTPGGTNKNGQNDTTSVTDLLADTYYISAALIPQISSSTNFDFGTFSFDGLTVSATDEALRLGTPPLHDVDGGVWDCHDISPHGIFDTYFTEFAFTFDPAKTVASYNTKDYPGGFGSGTGGTAYYQEFVINVSGLIYPNVVHFDLYETVPEFEDIYGTEKVCTKWKNGVCKAWKTTRVVSGQNIVDIDVNKFAPFSHDAESTPVPEPATLVLLGAGLVGLWISRKRMK